MGIYEIFKKTVTIILKKDKEEPSAGEAPDKVVVEVEVEKKNLSSRLKLKQGEEEPPEKEKPLEKEKESLRNKPEKENLKDVVSMIISPEERTVKNLINPFFWREKTGEFLKIREKQKQDLTIFETLAMGAAPTREYYVLTILSCIIATMGLIQGSAAVIIGAMIVAPLMTPILAFSLGVVWGDLLLIKMSFVSIIKGVFWAILISSSIAFIVPLPVLSGEIMARTTPSLFDVAVAIASGLVGAYGNANKKISNSLVGIAIAVALMPPLCTIGIGIGKLNMAVAGGATLLFLINLVCISLAGAIVFWLMKVQPLSADQSEVTRRAMSQIVFSVIILAVISIPVAFFMVDGYRKETALADARITIEREFPELSIVASNITGELTGDVLELSVTGVEKPDNIIMKNLIESLMKRHKSISEIDVRFFMSEPLGR